MVEFLKRSGFVTRGSSWKEWSYIFGTKVERKGGNSWYTLGEWSLKHDEMIFQRLRRCGKEMRQGPTIGSLPWMKGKSHGLEFPGARNAKKKRREYHRFFAILCSRLLNLALFAEKSSHGRAPPNNIHGKLTLGVAICSIVRSCSLSTLGLRDWDIKFPSEASRWEKWENFVICNTMKNELLFKYFYGDLYLYFQKCTVSQL